MPLSEFQYYLNRLYTEEKFRRRFFGNKDSFYKSESFKYTETIEHLEALKQEQIEFFAAGLLAKRKHALKDLIPCTIFFLNSEHNIHFQEFSREFLPSGIHKHHQDALEYCYFIQNKLKPKKQFRSILNFEIECLNNFLNPRAFKFRLFRIHPLRLKHALKKDFVNSTGFSPTLILWKNGAIHKVISLFK